MQCEETGGGGGNKQKFGSAITDNLFSLLVSHDLGSYTIERN